MNLEEKKKKYIQLLHAMQTGVAQKLNKDSSEGSPKHLRVGINSALIGEGTMTSLLIKKGIITEDEYFDELILFMEKEVESYEKDLENMYGGNVDIKIA